MVSYKSLRCGLQSNAKAVMDLIIEKTQSQRFFILYDNINFYENVCNQRLFNRSSLLNYTAGYIYFMKTNHCIEDSANRWEEQYINNSQIDWKLINELRNKDFDLTQADQDHCSAAIRYIIPRVLHQYFATAMHRQKNDCNIPIHRKWPSPLPDIKCKPDIANVLPLPTLASNKAIISGTIDIVQELGKRLELTNEVVRDKLILLKGDLMTIHNCRRAIFWWQAELLPLNRYSWLEPMAGLFYL